MCRVVCDGRGENLPGRLRKAIGRDDMRLDTRLKMNGYGCVRLCDPCCTQMPAVLLPPGVEIFRFHKHFLYRSVTYFAVNLSAKFSPPKDKCSRNVLPPPLRHTQNSACGPQHAWRHSSLFYCLFAKPYESGNVNTYDLRRS